MTELFAYTLRQKFCLDTPRTDNSLRRITENLLEVYKRIRGYPSMSIPPGTDTEKSSIGGYAGIAQFGRGLMFNATVLSAGSAA